MPLYMNRDDLVMILIAPNIIIKNRLMYFDPIVIRSDKQDYVPLNIYNVSLHIWVGVAADGYQPGPSDSLTRD